MSELAYAHELQPGQEIRRAGEWLPVEKVDAVQVPGHDVRLRAGGREFLTDAWATWLARTPEVVS